MKQFNLLLVLLLTVVTGIQTPEEIYECTEPAHTDDGQAWSCRAYLALTLTREILREST